MQQLFEESLVRKLQSELSDAIADIPQDTPPLRLAATKVRLAYSTLIRLREYVGTHPFPDRPTEIQYFRQLAPSLYGEYFFHSKWMHVEVQRAAGSRRALESYIQHELKGIELFYSRYSRLLCYEYSGETDWDDKWFVKGRPEIWMPEELAPLLDETFCLGSYLLAQLYANDRYRNELEDLSRRGGNAAPPSTTSGLPVLKWKGPKTELVELIVGLAEDGQILLHNKVATLWELKAFFEKHFQTDLRDFHALDVANRVRKRVFTPLLSRMLAKFLERRNKLLG